MRHNWTESSIKIDKDELPYRTCNHCDKKQVYTRAFNPYSIYAFYGFMISSAAIILLGIIIAILFDKYIGIGLFICGIMCILVLPYAALTTNDYYTAKDRWINIDDYESMKLAMQLSHIAGYYGL
jgi:hypothetical protein